MITSDHRVELISVNLSENHNKNDFNQSINRKGTLISRECSDPILVFISQVFQCNGLVLCVFKHIYNRLAVWNPYLGKRRWIERPKNDLRSVDRFAFGYDKSCGSYKILVIFVNDNQLEIYDLSSNSWKVLNVTLDQNIEIKYRRNNVSLKGNTYWHARNSNSKHSFIICFDFTRERFGPHLPLPFNYSFESDVSISAVGEDQLAMLMIPQESLVMEIWVTNKIEPDEVSWSKFLKVDMKPLACITMVKSFFIDEEKKIVVVFGEDDLHTCNNSANIIGANGYFRRVDLTKYGDLQLRPFACSYVPNSVHIRV